MSDTDHFLSFRVQGMRYALPLGKVERVTGLMATQAVPNGPAYLVGVFDLEGQSTLLVDLGMRLGLPVPETYKPDTPVLLCRGPGGLVACVIDEVEDIVDDADLQLGDTFTDAGLPFICVIHTPTGLAMLLNVDLLLDMDLKSSVAPAHIEAVPVDGLPGDIVQGAGAVS